MRISKIKFSGHGRAYEVDAAGRLIAHPDISLVPRPCVDGSELARRIFTSQGTDLKEIGGSLGRFEKPLLYPP
jgi:hypothetical protein